MHGFDAVLVFGAAESGGTVQRHGCGYPVNWEQADRLLGGCGMFKDTHSDIHGE